MQEFKSITSPRLIGRSGQLERLVQLLDQAIHQQGQCVLVSGEAGIGKSRLVGEGKRLALEAGLQTLCGYCFEQDEFLPYAPIQEMLRAWIAEKPEGASTGLPDLLAAEFCRLLPELGFQMPDIRPLPGLDREQEKRRTFEALTQFFVKIAEAKPLLMVCEDLHWSDDTSLEFLSHLARRIRTKPVLLIMTYRSDEIGEKLGRFLAMINRERLAEEIVLEHLTGPEVEDMITGIFELSRPMSTEFLDPVFELTEGNPFFVEEILKSLVMSGDIYHHQGGWDRKSVQPLRIPRSIQVVVEQRLKALSPPARELLRVAAVVGRRFDIRLLQAVMGMDETQLLALLREVITSQLVVEENEARFAFRHALTRNAIYATMLGLERKPYHQKIADSLEQMYAGRQEMVLTDLADHYFQAGKWEKTLKYASLAAEEAQRLYALQALIVQATRAIDAAAFLSTDSPAWLYHARGQARETLGEFSAAQSDYESALGLGQSAKDRKLEWQALLDLGLLWAARDYERTSRYYQQALAVAREIEEPDILAHTLNRAGNWHLNAGQPDDAIRFYRDALAIFEQLDDQPGMAQTMELLGMASGQKGDPESIGYYDRAIALCRKIDDRYRLVMCLGMRGFLSLIFSNNASFRLDRRQVMQDLEVSLKIARETGWRSGEAFTLLQICQVLEPLGEYRDTLRQAQEVARIANEIGHSQWFAASQIILGIVYFDILAFDRARKYLEQGFTLSQDIGSMIWTQLAGAFLSITLSFQGEPDQAEVILNRIYPTTSPGSYYEGMCACVQVRVALARSQPKQAIELLDRLSGAAPRLMPLFRWYLLNPGLQRAEALSLLGKNIEAESLLKEELEFARSLDIRPLAWRLLLVLGKLHHQNRRYTEAEVEFHEARGYFAALAEQIPDEDLKKSFLEQASALIPALPVLTTRQAAKLEFGGLTEREREVAGLIASGRSNREIGLTLSISERTTATHVGNILNKLAFSSRSQIAAWAVERGISSADNLPK